MNGLNSTNRRTVLKLTGAGIAGGTTLVGPATAGRAIDWFLEECKVVIPLVPVDTETINNLLPDGFTAQKAEDFSGAFQGVEQALMGLETFVCDEGRGLRSNGGLETIEDVPYMSHYTPVIPPEDLADDNATWHFFKWEVLISDAELRSKLNSEGPDDPARDGSATFAIAERDKGEFTFDVSGTFGGVTHRFVGEAKDPAPSDLTFREFTPTGNSGEFIRWDVDVIDAELRLGAADLKLETVSRPATVLETDSVENAPVLAGDLSFDPAKITLP